MLKLRVYYIFGSVNAVNASEIKRPKLAVWKFASCDGCQLSLLDCEDELLQVAEAIDIAHFLEASSRVIDGPYDLSLVEGSITSAHDAERIKEVREQSRFLVTIGACATSGGIQALKNYRNVSEYLQIVYAHPEYIDTLETSTPISDHVTVDFELRGCPIDKGQLLEVLCAYLTGRKPAIPSYSVCMECKRRGNICVMVAHQEPCLGPVTQAGCGALCPAYHRACFGCFGPQDTVNAGSISDRFVEMGMSREEISRIFRTFNAAAESFEEAGLINEQENEQ